MWIILELNAIERLIPLALVLIDILDLNDKNFQVHLTVLHAVFLFIYLLAVFITPLSLYCIYGAGCQKKVVIQELYLSN